MAADAQFPPRLPIVAKALAPLRHNFVLFVSGVSLLAMLSRHGGRRVYLAQKRGVPLKVKYDIFRRLTLRRLLRRLSTRTAALDRLAAVHVDRLRRLAEEKLRALVREKITEHCNDTHSCLGREQSPCSPPSWIAGRGHFRACLCPHCLPLCRRHSSLQMTSYHHQPQKFYGALSKGPGTQSPPSCSYESSVDLGRRSASRALKTVRLGKVEVKARQPRDPRKAPAKRVRSCSACPES